MTREQRRTYIALFVAFATTIAGLAVDSFYPERLRMPSGASFPLFVSVVAGIIACVHLLTIVTHLGFRRRNKPEVEVQMVSRLYRLAAAVAIAMSVAYGLGHLGSFASFFTLFGGMLLGWSLQAPVSGFAAWLMILMKRPFRPNDRVQLPSLGLTGDVHEIGPMYTVLNQVGGTIGSEEAVGRYILLPNAMLFSQVVINYTVTQEAAYMLDEVVIRITHDSDWSRAEQILLDAANEVTKEIIAKTGMKPYIRSDLYDYGVYLRLRFQTHVPDRPRIAYEITKRIFEAFQNEPAVDFAIPYVYSYRTGRERKEMLREKDAPQVREVEVSHIEPSHMPAVDPHDVEQLVESIGARGLLQPIVLVKKPGCDMYDIVAGHLRFEACKRLGWATVPAVIQSREER